MKKIFFILFMTMAGSAFSAENCSFNFKDFHSLLIQNSKKYTKLKPEVKDEISKTVTQQTRLKSGEELIFLGGGCAHFNYSLIFSRIKFKTDKVQEKFKKARDLVAYIDVQKGYTDVLIRALDESMKKPIQKSKTGVHDLPCGDAICTLDTSSKNSLKLNYSFAL